MSPSLVREEWTVMEGPREESSNMYNYLIYETADPRTHNWPSVSTPYPSIAISIVYLICIYIVFPLYMKNRRPFKLKTVIFYYNIFQIVANSLLVYGMLTSGWTTTYTLGCVPVDYSDNPESVRMLHCIYYVHVLKVIDLIETVFFILRKKYNQVSKLHVYHHTSTVLLSWMLARYVGGGMASFPPLLNCGIHVIMYTYYLISTLGPKWQRRVRHWKPRITILQMIQFTIMIIHSLSSLHPSCKVQKVLMFVYMPNIFLIYNMFWNFFKDAYLKKKETKAKPN